MADVILGPAGSVVLVDLDICVKTGQVTDQRAVIGGRTTPTWVTVLLVFTVIGFLFAQAMTSRRYRVDLPFSHAVHDRWRTTRRLAWIAAVAGAGALIIAGTSGTTHGSLWVGAGVALVAVALVVGTVNTVRNNVGVRVTRDDELVLTRAHPAFVEAARGAVLEPLVR